MSPDNQEPITPQNPPEALQPQPITAQSQGQPAQIAIVDPGQTFGIIGIVLGLLGFSLVGLIFSILGNNKAKAVGIKSTISIVGIWINAVILVLSILFIGFFILLLILGAAAGSE